MGESVKESSTSNEDISLEDENAMDLEQKAIKSSL